MSQLCYVCVHYATYWLKYYDKLEYNGTLTGRLAYFVHKKTICSRVYCIFLEILEEIFIIANEFYVCSMSMRVILTLLALACRVCHTKVLHAFVPGRAMQEYLQTLNCSW